MENNNYDSLMEHNIDPRNTSFLKHLFVISYLVNNKYVVIYQFKNGMSSISPSLVESTHYALMRKFQCTVTVYSFEDIVATISYSQDNMFEKGFQ